MGLGIGLCTIQDDWKQFLCGNSRALPRSIICRCIGPEQHFTWSFRRPQIHPVRLPSDWTRILQGRGKPGWKIKCKFDKAPFGTAFLLIKANLPVSASSIIYKYIYTYMFEPFCNIWYEKWQGGTLSQVFTWFFSDSNLGSQAKVAPLKTIQFQGPPEPLQPVPVLLYRMPTEIRTRH